jgi:hypothetical protein
LRVPVNDAHPTQGDPGGLEPIVPTVAPLTDTAGTPLPYLSSDTITAFSIGPQVQSGHTGVGALWLYRSSSTPGAVLTFHPGRRDQAKPPAPPAFN